MVKITEYIAALILFLLSIVAGTAQETITVKSFDKVIVSPHIQVTFEEGSQESVTIENAKVSREKINIEMEGKTLRVYLDGAKMVTKNKKGYDHRGWKTRKPLYKGTQVIAKITYKTLNALSIRGEEVVLCKSPIDQDDFKFSIYGEPKVTVNKIVVKKLKVAMYGEGYLELKEGNVMNQKYTVYGEGDINTLGIGNKTTKITAYGEGSFRVNVSDNLLVTAFGEASVAYHGDPSVDKGIIIGNATIQKMN